MGNVNWAIIMIHLWNIFIVHFHGKTFKQIRQIYFIYETHSNSVFGKK
uniref:Uncharacterized protein n=1 Tax=Anguilla anguilla TaxID=7936 RepID=A0A0E9S8H7_ANGAN